MWRRALRFGLCCTLVLLACAARAAACSCEKPGPPCQELGSAAAVFVGTVTGITEGARKQKPDGKVDFTPRLVKFAVQESFFGVAAQAEVATGLGSGDCGYAFVKGTSYLVYAYRNEKGERLSTSSCTRTRPAAGVSEDLQFLRGLAAAPSGVTLSGKVERILSYPAPNGQRPHIPMEGAVLSVESAGQTKEARADSLGRYTLTGLRPGLLKLKLQLPDELTTYKSERLLNVVDRGCASEDFYVTDNGRMSGSVFDAEGNPAAGVEVVVLNVGESDIEMSDGRYAKTDEEGHYAISGLPPGRLVLGVNVRGVPRSIEPAELPKDYECTNCRIIVELNEAGEQANAYPRMFYPGVFHVSKAEVFSLAVGQELRDIDLHLPPRPAEAVVKGKVVWEDGKPAAGAQVGYRDVTYEDLKVYQYGVRADERGEFSFKAYMGGRYALDAWANRQDAQRHWTMGLSDPRQTVTMTKPEETVTVVLIPRIK